MLPRARALPQRRSPPRVLAVALALLALGTTPITLLHPASAQAPLPGGDVTINFDREPANYLEGSRVVITFSGSLDPGLVARVHCRTCPDKDVSYTTPTERQLVFPDDFGVDARNARQPKWNDTWDVDLLLGQTVLQSRPFRVWAANFFEFPDNAPRPSGLFLVQAAGFGEGGLAQIVLKHRRGDGTWETRFAVDAAVNSFGRASYFWRIPLDEAQRMRCPPRPTGYCETYELTLKGPGKADEVLRFRMKPATLIASANSGNGTARAEAMERTENVTVRADIRYPGGLRLAEEHVRSPDNPDGVLKFRVERRQGDDGGEIPAVVANVSATFDDARDLWIAVWSIPRDIRLRVDYRYSLVLVDQKDRWGNNVPRQTLNNFTIDAATLTPVVVRLPREVERTDEAKVVVRFRYHDGSFFTPNDTAPQGRWKACFVQDDPGPSSCSQGRTAGVRYWTAGLWNFTTRYPRAYSDLSGHQFRYEGGTVDGQDAYGNVWRTILSSPFQVVPAKLRVNLTTTVGSELRTEARGLDRGDLVTIVANVTYPDGNAFNTSMNENRAPRIQVLVTRIASDGALAGEEYVNLTNADPRSPFWTGTMRVSRDASLAPIGRWTFTFHVRDNETPPNLNDTEFRRLVNPAEIQVVPVKEPARTASIGTVVAYSFQLVYDDGTYATASDVGTSFQVQIMRAAGPRRGTFVSGALLPSYDPARKVWSVDWEVPRILFQGQYAFKPLGTDRHGNFVDRDALSRPFATFTDSAIRVALTEPPTTVERGSQVIAVFDGRDGDIGVLGWPDTFPAIELQRFDSAESAWVTERRDVRSRGEGDGDHVARLNTSISTTLGLYRFQLRGRDSTYNLINGTSEPFTLVPTNVTRPLLVPPPERVAKGQYIEWSVEREAGDVLSATDVLYNGRPVSAGNLVSGLSALSGPIYQASTDRFNFTWRVPYASESGAYGFLVKGRDAYQNRLLVEVPPVGAEPSVLTGRVIGNPERVVARGGEARFLFAITYPNGDFFASRALPRAIVVNDSGVVANARVDASGLSLQASWKPPLTGALDDFWFEITGQDASGNVFPALRSEPFTLAPGAADRAFVTQPKLSYKRLETVRAELPSAPGDVFAAFTLSYIGDASSITSAIVGTNQGTIVANLEHTLDPNSGRYVATWRTDRAEKTGVYRIGFSGQDEHGNEIKAASEPFSLQPTTLIPRLDPVVEADFQPGAEMEFTFELAYAPPTSRAADPAATVPDAVILWTPPGEGTPRPAAQRPEVSFDAEAGRWVARWTVPEDLPNGRYVLVVQGADEAGNPISARTTAPIRVDVPVVASFKKVLGVPAPTEAATLATLALVALALAATGRARRRED